MTGSERDIRDRTWIVRLQAGDESALGELFRAYYSELVSFARRYVSSPDLALDVLQDVFTGLWLQRQDVRITATVASYLYGAVRHRCLNIRRHERLAERWVVEQESIMAEIPSMVLPNVDTLELSEAIEYAVSQLPPRAQEIFRMCRENGLSHQEVATTLGISVNAVAVTMTRALRALHESLRDWL